MTSARDSVPAVTRRPRSEASDESAVMAGMKKSGAAISSAWIAGVCAALFVLSFFVFRVNADKRVTTPIASFPQVTLHPLLPDRTVDAYGLFGMPMDFQVYYSAGKAMAAGMDIYTEKFFVMNWGQGFVLPFTYPPFAAWLMRYYSNLSFNSAVWLWQLASFASLAAVFFAILLLKRVRFGLSTALFVILLMVACFAFVPARSNFYWGQINIIIMAILAFDFLRGEKWSAIRNNGWTEDRWYAGIGVGLAAAVKVYPAFFGIIFLLQRRWRAAITSAVTFGLTVGIGFLVVPEAGEYWSKIMVDTDRFKGVENVTSQSIGVSLQRDFGTDSFLLWLLLALIVTAISAFAAWRALLHDDRPMALSIIGLAACVVSPFSWHHYYVWIFPLMLTIGLNVAQRFSDCRSGTHAAAPVGFADRLIGIIRDAFGGLIVTALSIAALWPYVSVVFLLPFDIYRLGWYNDNPFLASATAWWTVVLLVAMAVYYGVDLFLQRKRAYVA